MTLFLMAIYDILEELGNEVDGSLFVDNLVIYITRNQWVAARYIGSKKWTNLLYK